MGFEEGAAAPGGGAGELEAVSGPRGGGRGGERHGRVGAGGLPQAGPHAGAGRVEDLAESVEGLAVEHVVEVAHGGVEQPVAFGEVAAERLPGAGEGPGADAEFEPPAAERVHCGRVLGDPQGSSSGRTRTPVPRRMRLVCWAIAARTTRGAATCSLPWRKCRWITQPES
nr:hypothetical protein GCM10025732_44420 [Glycomyces mayteni]